MKKFTLLTAAIALIAVAAVQAEDKPAPKKHEGGRPMMEQLLPPMAVEKLNLTADQKAKLDELNAGFKKDMEQYKKDHPVSEADREAMKKARESGDKEAMKAAREKLAETMKGAIEIRKGYMEKFKATLTDEQKKQLEEMRPHRGPGAGGEKKHEKK